MNLPLVPPAAHRPPSFAAHVLPAFAYSALLFYGGLIRMSALPKVGFVATDKLLHALAFGALALLAARAVHWLRPGFSGFRKLALGVLASSWLGLLLELCQAFTSYRSADGWDWVADTVGAVLAASVAFGLLRSFSPRGA